MKTRIITILKENAFALNLVNRKFNKTDRSDINIKENFIHSKILYICDFLERLLRVLKSNRVVALTVNTFLN